jgi:hypothetical protein
MLANIPAMLAVLTVRPRFANPDMWWHLKIGEVIWTSRTIPTTDLFSYTTNHHAWIRGDHGGVKSASKISPRPSIRTWCPSAAQIRVLDEFRKWAQLQTDPHMLLDKYRFNFCVLSHDFPMTVVVPRLLLARKEVYSDRISPIFIRSAPSFVLARTWIRDFDSSLRRAKNLVECADPYLWTRNWPSSDILAGVAAMSMVWYPKRF